MTRYDPNFGFYALFCTDAEEAFSPAAVMTGWDDVLRMIWWEELSKPKPCLCRASSITEENFPPGARRFSDARHSSWLLKFPASQQSHWVKHQPLDVSPPDGGTVGLGDLWAVAGCTSSHTCVIHICCRTHGRLVWAWTRPGSHGMCVSETEWEGARGAAVPHYTDDRSVGGRRKMN